MFGRFFDRFKRKPLLPESGPRVVGPPPEPPRAIPAQCGWRPDAAQAGRIATLVARLEAIVPRTWRIAEHTEGHTKQYEPWPVSAHFDRPPLAQYYQSTIEQVSREFPEPVLGRAMADMAFFPAAWNPRGIPSLEIGVRFDLTREIGYRWITDRPDAYALDLLVRRTRYILENPFHRTELTPEYSQVPFESLYEAPRFRECLSFLCALRAVPAARSALVDFTLGKWDAPVPEIPSFVSVASTGASYPQDTRYRILTCSWYDAMESCLETLYEDGLLTYDTYRRVLGHFPAGLYTRGWIATATDERPLYQTLAAYVRRLAWECAEDPMANELHLDKLHGFQGARFLLKACEHATRLRIDEPLKGFEHDPVRRFIFEMARLHALDPEDDEASVVSALRTYPHSVLKALLPHSGVAQPLMSKALGTERTDRLREVMLRIAGRPYGYAGGDIPNCDDPESGVIDRDEVVAAVNHAGPAAAQELVRTFRRTSPEYQTIDRTLTLIRACMGWNRANVEASAVKHGQVALKAYGLLPIGRGEAEVMERYLLLKRAERAAPEYGRDRRVNTGAAVQAGLTNLARNAGYPDATRLEWAMEARLAAEQASESPVWEIDGHHIELVLEPAPRLAATKDGRTLKSVPGNVRKLPAYRDAKGMLLRYEAQAGRFRDAVERMMVEGDTLAIEELRRMFVLRVGRGILTAVVFGTPGGTFGLFDGDTLRAIDGAIVTAEQVFAAHPVVLRSAGVLEAWQQELTRRRIDQPFEQLARAVYSMTPDERATWPSSSRYEGRVLKATLAFPILAARGWDVQQDGQSTREFRNPRVSVAFVLEGLHRYVGENAQLRSGLIRFSPIAADELPPRLFSEVMRDIDSVVQHSTFSI